MDIVWIQLLTVSGGENLIVSYIMVERRWESYTMFAVLTVSLNTGNRARRTWDLEQ